MHFPTFSFRLNLILLLFITLGTNCPHGGYQIGDSLRESAPHWGVSAAANSVPSILADYDSPNFLCENYHRFCDNILSDLGCTSITSSDGEEARKIVGCVNDDISQFIGTCECNKPYFFEASTTVTSQLVSNRIEGMFALIYSYALVFFLYYCSLCVCLSLT